ncbi:hypothetical protein VZT92_017421 [Zoarces viviparus]|uniref:Tetratricopeptide repeat protein 29 n=1 Tax=Zoarces viviparus TaxID=48416 RepID=A0AAW1ES88_ZOAVI
MSDNEECLQFFKSCIQMYDTLQDGLEKSYRPLESESNKDDTLQCLEKMADISRSNGLQPSLADAIICLGNIYYRKSQWKRAGEYFLQRFEVLCKLEDVSLLQRVQVSLASARAHSLISQHGADVEASWWSGKRPEDVRDPAQSHCCPVPTLHQINKSYDMSDFLSSS